MAAGVTDEDIAFAVKRLAEIGGGFVVAAEGRVLAEVQLEIGGLVTEQTIDQVADECLKLDEAARGLGYCLELPEGLHMALSFLSLPPRKNKPLKLSDMGLLGLIEIGGVEKAGLVPLVVECSSP
jgi:adenine deaminase